MLAKEMCDGPSNFGPASTDSLRNTIKSGGGVEFEAPCDGDQTIQLKFKTSLASVLEQIRQFAYVSWKIDFLEQDSIVNQKDFQPKLAAKELNDVFDPSTIPFLSISDADKLVHAQFRLF